VNLKYDDDKPADVGEGLSREVMKQLHQTYASELEGKQFAYDGEKNLFTVGPLPFKNNVFDVVVADASSGKYIIHRVDLIFSLDKANLFLS
jgi:eukaryotic translation initiation factor 2C